MQPRRRYQRRQFLQQLLRAQQQRRSTVRPRRLQGKPVSALTNCSRPEATGGRTTYRHSCSRRRRAVDTECPDPGLWRSSWPVRLPPESGRFQTLENRCPSGRAAGAGCSSGSHHRGGRSDLPAVLRTFGGLAGFLSTPGGSASGAIRTGRRRTFLPRESTAGGACILVRKHAARVEGAVNT